MKINQLSVGTFLPFIRHARPVAGNIGAWLLIKLVFRCCSLQDYNIPEGCGKSPLYTEQISLMLVSALMYSNWFMLVILKLPMIFLTCHALLPRSSSVLNPSPQAYLPHCLPHIEYNPCGT